MKTSLLPSLAALACLLAPTPALAQSAQLVGTLVDANGVGIVGVDIDVLNDGSGGDPTLQNDGTGPGGAFSVVVDPAGTYRIRFNPLPAPAPTRMLVELPDVVVSGTTNLGTVVMPPGVRITGSVLNPSNAPVFNVDLDIVDETTGQDVPLSGDNTDAQGRFEVVGPVGPLELRFDPSNVVGQTLAPTALPLDPGGDVDIGDVHLAQGFLVTAIVRTTAGVPVQNADLDAIDTATGEKLYTPGDNTNSTGFVDFVVPAGTYDVFTCPPPGMQLVADLRENFPVNANASLGIISLANGVVLSGTVLAYQGSPVSGVDVDVDDSSTGASIPLCTDNTNAQGQYSVVVPQGVYDVTFSPSYQLPLAADVRSGQVVTGNTVVNGTLPRCDFFVTYGDGLPGTGGITPSLTASGGTPRLNNDGYTLEVSDGRGGAAAMLYVSIGKCPGGDPMGGPLFLARRGALLGQPVLLSLSGPNGVPGAGSASHPLPIGSNPNLVGLPIYGVVLVADPQGPGGFSQTPILCTPICQ